MCCLGILAILVGGIAMPLPAYAEGTLEIVPSDHVMRSYSAWKLLDGNVSGKVASHTLTDVSYTGALSAEGWQELGAPQGTAQDVAEWIADASPADLAVRLMWAVEASGIPADKTDIHTGTAELSDGYWLVSSDDSSPILVLVGGGVTTKVTEKAEAPVLVKEVATDSGWSDFAVAGADLDPEYRLIGTIPSNYDSFPSYRYEFDDKAAESLEIDPSSVKVEAATADGSSTEDLTGQAKISVEGSSLAVAFDDLKEALPERGAWRTVTVSYTAHLTPQATFGLSHTNNNEAALIYTRRPVQKTAAGVSARALAGRVGAAVAWSSKPGRIVPAASADTATSERQQCQVATWAVHIQKKDATDSSSLAGAGFTVQDEKGLFINTDGTATEERTDASLWRTASDGTVTIASLSNGTFTLKEAEVPDGYEAASDVTVELQGDRDGLKAKAEHAELASTDATSGIVDITVEDPRKGTEAAHQNAGGAGASPTQTAAARGGILADTSDTTRIGIIAAVAGAGIIALSLAILARRKFRNKQD